ncbi:MAG: archease [Anaerolineae bacterium]|nr:archease [Anaerolineae bacterium]
MFWEEISHTADLSLHVWGEDLRALFENAARGVLDLMGGKPDEHLPMIEKSYDLCAPDWETLLVDWLTELLYLAEDEGVLVSTVTVTEVGDLCLRASVSGWPGGRYDKLIKAVTYHDLAIVPTERGYEVVIVFDV